MPQWAVSVPGYCSRASPPLCRGGRQKPLCAVRVAGHQGERWKMWHKKQGGLVRQGHLQARLSQVSRTEAGGAASSRGGRALSAQGGEERCQAPREPGARRETRGSQPSRTPRPHVGRGQAVERMPEDRTLPERLSDPSETVGTRGDQNTLDYKGILSGNKEH